MSFRLIAVVLSPFLLGWLGNNHGLTEAVPSPWVAVEADGEQMSSLTAQVEWCGRRWLPCSALVNGHEALSGQPFLDLVVNGRRIRDRFTNWHVVSQSARSITIREIRIASSVRVDFKFTWNFDNFLRFDMILWPLSESATIDTFLIRLPLEDRTLYKRALFYDFDLARADRAGIVSATGYARDGVTFGFLPYLWTGSAKGGLEWLQETNKGVSIGSQNTFFAYQNGELVVRYVDQPFEFEGPLSYSWAWLLTPTKPRVDNVHQVRFSSGGTAGVKARSEGSTPGLWRFVHMSNFSVLPQQYPGQPWADPAQLESYQQIIDDAASSGVEVIPYSGFYSFATNIPELSQNIEEWEGGLLRRGPIAWQNMTGNEFSTQRVTMKSRSIKDFIVGRHRETIIEHGLKGMYVDLAIPLEPVSPEPGVLRYDLYAHRDFLQRYWTMAKEIDPSFTIVHHNGGRFQVNASYADIVVGGEEYNVIFSEGEPDYNLVPDVVFPGGFLHENGATSMLIPQINKEVNLTRHLLGLLFSNEVALWHRSVHSATVDALYLELESLGSDIVFDERIEGYFSVGHFTGNGVEKEVFFNTSQNPLQGPCGLVGSHDYFVFGGSC